MTAKGDLSRFPDGSQVQDWALPAMSWANGNALINGHDDGILEPGWHHYQGRRRQVS